MENTCTFDDCFFAGLIDRKEQCPNYLATTWREEKTGEFKRLEDCSPRRTTLMIQGMLARILALQQTDESQRNVNTDLIVTMTDAINIIQANPNASLQVALTAGKTNQTGRLQAENTP